MPRVAVVHFGEIGLKGGNRAAFERRLQRNLQGLLEGTGAGQVRRVEARLEVVLPEGCDPAVVLDRLARIPGVVSAAIAERVSHDLDAIRDHVVALARAEAAPITAPFRITTQRAWKGYPHKSLEISRTVGAAVATATGRPVDLEHPASIYEIEIGDKSAWVWTGRVPGPGGLPVGVSGRIVALISGGLDSPVAAWRMMRRGAEIVVAHFRNETLAGAAGGVEGKLRDLCAILARGQGRVPLWIVPFGDLQRAIIASVPDRIRMLVYRRVMFRLGDRIRDAVRGGGLVVGDSLGQVASQTLENLGVLYAAARPPVFAPLSGSDKTEIMAEARRIGTYDVSIRPYPDCCSFLVASHPETRATREKIEAAEAACDLAPLMDAALAAATREEVGPDWSPAPAPLPGPAAPVPAA